MQSIELPEFIDIDVNLVDSWSGRISLLIVDKKLSSIAKRLDKKMNGSLKRAINSRNFNELKEGESISLAFPAGLEAESIQIIKVSSQATALINRYCGSNLSFFKHESDHLLLLGSGKQAQEIILGLTLKNYRFHIYKNLKKLRSLSCIKLLFQVFI